MSYFQNVKVIPTHEDIFGTPAKSEKAIITELQEFNSIAILHICTKLMLFLNSEGGLGIQKQIELARQLLDQESKTRLVQFVKENDSPDVAFFHHIPVLMMIKLNLEHNDTSGLDIHDERTRSKFTSLLSSVCDLWICDIRIGSGGDPNRIKRFKEEFRIFQARQFLLEGNEPVINMLARGRYLLKKVRDNPDLEFDKLFKQATGLEVDIYLGILFMVMIQWTIKVEGKTLDEVAVRNIDQFFKQTTLKKEDIENFLDVVSFNYSDYNQLNSEMLSKVGMKDNSSLTSFIPFMVKPILRFDKNFICLSPNFLALQLTEGPYNIVRETVKDAKDPNVLVHTWGNVYENYILDRLSSTFGKFFYPNLLDKEGKEVLDGLVDLGNALLLVEVKYIHWSYRARLSGKKEDMYEFIKKFAAYPQTNKWGKPKGEAKKAKGLGQIKKFVEKLESNQVEMPVSTVDKMLIPVIILGEEFPCDPLNRELLENYVASRGCTITSDKVMPFIILTSEDVELIESLAEGKDLEQVKSLIFNYSSSFHPKNRSSSYSKRISSFKNEIFNSGIKVRNNTFIRKQLKEHTDPLHDYFIKTEDTKN